MKRKIYLFSLFIVTICTLTSCYFDNGGTTMENASMTFNYSGTLLSKTPLDFDDRLGCEVLVYKVLKDSTPEKTFVWISKNTFLKIPRPSDSCIVKIEYIKYLKSSNRKDANVCVGYHTEKR